MLFQVRIALWLAGLIAAVGVRGAEAPLSPEQAQQHVLMVNERGQHLDPARKWKLYGNPRDAKPFGLTNNILSIETGIQRFYRNFHPSTATNQPTVVIFVHGGLNSYRNSRERLAKLLKLRMVEEGFYPVLLVWNSGFFDSYFEHLLSVRQGEVRPTLGKLTSPVVFLIDIGKGAVRLPLTLTGRWYNDIRTAEIPNVTDGATIAWEDLEARLDDWQKQEPNFNGNLLIRPPQPEGDIRGWDERLFRLFCYYATQPTKIAILPLADGLASEAWDNMIRRTKTMFQPPETYDFPRKYRKALEKSVQKNEASKIVRQADVAAWMARKTPAHMTNSTSVSTDGTMYQFAKRLEVWTTNQVFPRDLRWHFYGHSMGAMVLNELFRVAPDIRAEQVTYMAAACSIRSFQESLVPYLRRQMIVHSNEVHFHNLCLHRIRERDNSMDKVDLIPRGTLLNYIDDIFAKPATITDRTLGSWENVIRALPDLPEDLRPRIHNVCFDLLPWSFSAGNTNQPQNHSSFGSKFAFWRDDFVKGPEDPSQKQAQPAMPGPVIPAQPTIRQSPPLK